LWTSQEAEFYHNMIRRGTFAGRMKVDTAFF